MNTDRSMTGSISNDQNIELEITYLRALAKARLSMTSEQAQAQITNPDALVSAIRKINFPLTVVSKSCEIGYIDLSSNVNARCIDFSSLSPMPKFENGYIRREIHGLKMFGSPNVAEVVSQVRSVGLELGTVGELYTCALWVVSLGMLDQLNLLTVVSEGPERWTLIRRAGNPKVEMIHVCEGGNIPCDMDKTLVIGFKNPR